jgi:CMP-N-acetylneuraminic acid synthetase
MVAYSIEAAQQTVSFDDVYVCTDDAEIADIARDYGATVPYLMPDELCTDLSGSHEPCLHLADHLAEEGDPRETIVLLQPTSPLRLPVDIEDGLAEFQSGNYDFVVSVTHIDPHYFHWAMKERDDGYWQMHFGDRYLQERPTLPDRYRPNGSIKIADLDALAETGHFFGDNCGVIETPMERSVHVGTQYEFDITEFLMTKRDSND